MGLKPSKHKHFSWGTAVWGCTRICRYTQIFKIFAILQPWILFQSHAGAEPCSVAALELDSLGTRRKLFIALREICWVKHVDISEQQILCRSLQRVGCCGIPLSFFENGTCGCSTQPFFDPPPVNLSISILFLGTLPHKHRDNSVEVETVISVEVCYYFDLFDSSK